MKVHAKDIVDKFRKYKVLVIGDAILDAYIKGTADRICREAPVPVINVQEQENSCGGAANTAINMVALGAETHFLSVIGKDTYGNQLLEALNHQGVCTNGVVQDDKRQTISKVRISASCNILLRVDQGSTADISESCAMNLYKSIMALAEEVDAIVISDYGCGIFTDKLIKKLDAIKRKNSILIVDAKEPQKFRTLSPTAVKPNYEESIQMLGLEKLNKGKRLQQIRNNGAKLLDISGAQYVAATMDADGTFLFERGKKAHKVSCIPHDDKDAIGAGDTFVSALTLSLCAGATAKTAVEIASAAASIVIEKEGTEMCTDIELKSYLGGNLKFIPSLEDLALKVKDLRKEHKRIIFTNGCFDIIHRGHVNFLNLAKAEGDVLVVGLNSDESIRNIKGNDRPINKLDDRVAVLAGLENVDYLIPFDEDSPIDILKTLRPEVFVKGGTYTVESLPEAELVKQLGGKVSIIPLTADFSTGKLIEKIRQTTYGLSIRKSEKSVL